MYRKGALDETFCLSRAPYCGTTRIRTGDTRIFSPMLYQLSYGTNVLLNCECKGTSFSRISKIFPHFFRGMGEKSAEVVCLYTLYRTTLTAQKESLSSFDRLILSWLQ